jgi:hypothetical protein
MAQSRRPPCIHHIGKTCTHPQQGQEHRHPVDVHCLTKCLIYEGPDRPQFVQPRILTPAEKQLQDEAAFERGDTGGCTPCAEAAAKRRAMAAANQTQPTLSTKETP